ncbi:hypothetical protein C8F04DRAFT_1259882 [Mycena alexandri]|uniref:Uncharacterized protein n=1 Tax=Mycena alexandri TaxID=1745969 RepID=A0AAD6X0J4_9AGAR|nr:hypothetical protein C8F04DRAFT_1259882 [Mycena alexandri]
MYSDSPSFLRSVTARTLSPAESGSPPRPSFKHSRAHLPLSPSRPHARRASCIISAIRSTKSTGRTTEVYAPPPRAPHTDFHSSRPRSRSAFLRSQGESDDLSALRSPPVRRHDTQQGEEVQEPELSTRPSSATLPTPPPRGDVRTSPRIRRAEGDAHEHDPPQIPPCSSRSNDNYTPTDHLSTPPQKSYVRVRDVTGASSTGTHQRQPLAHLARAPACARLMSTASTASLSHLGTWE